MTADPRHSPRRSLRLGEAWRLRIAGLVVCMLVAVACGDDGSSPEVASTGTTGEGPSHTMPVYDSFSWSPAETPDEGTEERITSLLYETDQVMILPATPAAAGDETTAAFTAEGTASYPGGPMLWAHAVLEISTDQGVIVTVSTPAEGACPAGATVVTFRGDPQACLTEGDSTVSWSESGALLSAAFGPGLDVEAGLAWLDTWVLQPPVVTAADYVVAWTPAESPSEADLAKLTALLDGWDSLMVIPTSAPPTGTQAEATIDFASMDRALEIRDSQGPLVTVTWAANECLPDMPQITLRGDTDACATAQAGAYWTESGESLSAIFPERADMPFDAALAWLETWQILPFSCDPGWADLDADQANGCEYSWLDAYEPNDTPLSAHSLGTLTPGQTLTVASTVAARGGDPVDWYALNLAEGPQVGGEMRLLVTAAQSSAGYLHLYDFTNGSLTAIGSCNEGDGEYEGGEQGCAMGWPMQQQMLFTWSGTGDSAGNKLVLIKVNTNAGVYYPEDYELTILFEE
jgi:hypothetical protein